MDITSYYIYPFFPVSEGLPLFNVIVLNKYIIRNEDIITAINIKNKPITFLYS